MDEKVTKFPITHYQRYKNKLGPRAVECQVTGRYLQFDEKSVVFDSGEFITVDVMAAPDGDPPGRKICQLIITREELMKALEHVKPTE